MLIWFSGGIGAQVGRAQTMAAPAYKATFSWSLATNATVVRASTNTQVTCTVDISLTGDSYKPLPAWVMPVPSIIGAGGSTSISTNYDYSPNWAQYVCVFTPSDPGNITLQVDAGSDSSSRAVTAVRLDAIVFSPGQVIAVSNAVTMTATVLPNTFAGTFVWTGPTNTTGTTATVTLDYGGHVPVWVTLVETGETMWTELVVLNPTLTVFAKDDPGFVGDLTGFDVLVENDEGLSHTVIWSGAVTGTNNTYTPSSFGTKTATATVTVGPWTGSASADQNVYQLAVMLAEDNEGNVTHTYQVDGPGPVNFPATAAFTNEYDLQLCVDVGTTRVTMHLSQWERLDYGIDDSPIDSSSPGDSGGTPSAPVAFAPESSSAESTTDAPQEAAFAAINPATVKKVLELLAGAKAVKELAGGEKNVVLKIIVVPEAVTLPAAQNYAGIKFTGKVWDPGILDRVDTLTSGIDIRVVAGGALNGKKAWAIRNKYEGTARTIVEVSSGPIDVCLQFGALQSPRRVKPLLTAFIKANRDDFDSDSLKWDGEVEAAANQTDGKAENRAKFVMLGGRTADLECSGNVVIPREAEFDHRPEPKEWSFPKKEKREVGSISITLRTP